MKRHITDSENVMLCDKFSFKPYINMFFLLFLVLYYYYCPLGF
jgi:hypothetical protein